MFVGLSVTQAVIDRIRARPPAGNLMDTWVFGCPPDPTQARSPLAADCLLLQQLSGASRAVVPSRGM